MLGEYSELLNRLAGMADEMSSFYRRIKDLDTTNFQSKETMIKTRKMEEKVQQNQIKVDKVFKTSANEIISDIINE